MRRTYVIATHRRTVHNFDTPICQESTPRDTDVKHLDSLESRRGGFVGSLGVEWLATLQNGTRSMAHTASWCSSAAAQSNASLLTDRCHALEATLRHSLVVACVPIHTYLFHAGQGSG
jgi:hypothetical protein